jgi:hypothetical protein
MGINSAREHAFEDFQSEGMILQRHKAPDLPDHFTLRFDT